MNRRTGIKTLLIISAAATLMPQCLQTKKKTLPLKNLSINEDEEATLVQLSDDIIPSTGTPGAKDVAAHVFAIMMVDDCFPPVEQKKFQKGLGDFEDLASKKFNRSFSSCQPAERMELLKTIGGKNGITEDATFFYNAVKRLTIQAYTSSEYYLTKVQGYKLVPGRFYGCVPVHKAS
jgi:Gluconate 2-dehydrogenase subunit 3